jgi:hypothetical protein
MIGPRREMDRGSRVQLLAVVAVTIIVMILGTLVVLAPERMGVPRPSATPAASPTVDATETPSP